MLRSGRCFVGKVLGRGPNGLPPTCIPVALRNNSRINFLAAGMGYSANRDIEVTVMFGSARRLGVAPAISTTPRALLRAVALFLLAATLFTAPICAGAGIYGGWVPAPDVLAPGIPVAELTIGGSPYLLLEGAGSAAPLDAVLWNPGNTISLTPGPGVVIDILNGVAGMQTSAGPRVFAWGNFELAGVATRIMMWDGTAWGLPGGAILGVVPRVADVRNTPAGPELWVGGDLMLFPGLAGATSLAHFDGVQWATPGVVLGIVKELMVAAEGSLNGDSIYIAGALGSAGGVPLQNLGRYDGGWSDVAGGLPGPDHSLSLIEFTPGQPEIWVTVAPAIGVSGASLFQLAQGVWEDRTPPFQSMLPSTFGQLSLLPTFFGPWVFTELPTFTQGEWTALGWDPSTETWQPVTTGSAFAYSFDSPSGIFPPGIYNSNSNPLSPWRWEVNAGEFIRGDANVDGVVNIADVIRILGVLFPHPNNPMPPLSCLDAARVNGDTAFNIADAIFLLGALFSGPNGPNSIPPPFPGCGLDTSFTAAGCDVGPSICP